MLCDRCETEGVVYRMVTASQTTVIVERCPVCKRNTCPGHPFLSKKDFDNIEELPLFVDYTEYSEPCAVHGCGRIDTQLHHFAPRHLFGYECEDWPTAYLCMEHHLMWHRLTMTGMYAIREKV